MPVKTDKALRRWLIAERRAEAVVAERALAEVLRGLPLANPSPRFAKRVLAAVDLRLEPRPLPWWARLAVAASVLLSALSLLVVVPAVFEALRLLGPAEVVTGLVATLEALAHRLADLRPFWVLATRLRDALATLVALPPVSLALLLALALSSAALRGLMELLSPYRRPAHVTL